jgi:hypothetical protein
MFQGIHALLHTAPLFIWYGMMIAMETSTPITNDQPMEVQPGAQIPGVQMTQAIQCFQVSHYPVQLFILHGPTPAIHQKLKSTAKALQTED